LAGSFSRSWVVVVLQQTLSLDELKEWGWRVPFLFGAVAAIVALYLRRSFAGDGIGGDHAYKEAGSLSGPLASSAPPDRSRIHDRRIGSYFYTFTTYLQKFLVNSVKMDAKTVSLDHDRRTDRLHASAPVFAGPLGPDRRRNNMILSVGCATFASCPAF